MKSTLYTIPLFQVVFDLNSIIRYSGERCHDVGQPGIAW